MGKIQVLVASDYQLLRSALRQLLRTQDAFDVLSVDVDAGETLVQSYPAISPDVLLLELARKSSAGVRLPARILTKAPTARILLLTTIEDIAFVRSMFSTGVLGYLLKTAAQSELFQALRDVYRRRPFLDPRLARSATDHLFSASSDSVQGGKRKKLSRREMEVLEAIALGHTTKEIARALEVSEKTVQTYRERIYTKLELQTRSDLVHYALAHGLGWDIDS